MVSDDYFARRRQFDETLQRARRYDREDGAKTGPRSAVLSACTTMLFRPTDAEVIEMTEQVRASRRLGAGSIR